MTILRSVCAALLIAGAAEAANPKFRLGPSENFSEPGKSLFSDAAQKLANRGMAAFQRGDLASAKASFQLVLELAPGNLATTINLGLIEYREKNFAAAEDRLKQAVRRDPEAALAWLILGVVQYEQNKLDAALAALAQAVLLEPKDPRAHHYLGVTVGRKGWYSAAEDEMRKAIELDPDYAEAHYNLAVFYLERVPPAVELARRHYQKSLDLGADPDSQVEQKLGK